MDKIDVVAQIWQSLRGMLIGVLGVFIVLAVFYIVLRLMMAKTDREYNEARKQKEALREAEALEE